MAHPQTDTRRPAESHPGIGFACWPGPVVGVSWLLIVLAADSWNFALMGVAMLSAFVASMLAPVGLFIAIRAHRSTHAEAERPAIMFALVGNSLVLIQILLILALIAYEVRPGAGGAAI
jgi:hypothetical protein